MRILPKRKYKSGNRWGLWRWTDVDPVGDGDIYLTRLHLLQTPFGAIMLHWINRPDPQPDLHDHPVSFLSIVLTGGYTEEVGVECNDGAPITRVIRYWNFIKATDKHRIVELRKPTLTLVFAGPVVRSWGFWTKKGWVPWRTYRPLEGK